MKRTRIDTRKRIRQKGGATRHEQEREKKGERKTGKDRKDMLIKNRHVAD